MAVGEWDQRQLCSDGACIGVIGGDGTCKVCGRAAPNWGDERNRGLNPPPGDQEDAEEEEDLATNDEYGDDEGEADDDDGGEDGDEGDDEDGDEDERGDDAVAEGAVAAAANAPRGEWSGRRLCPDGACIGVIGADGRCRVCGRRASGAAGDALASTTASSTASGEIGSDAATTASGETGSAAAPPAPAEDPALAATVAASSAGDAAGRELCSVTGCGGYIGDNGRCAVCSRGAS